MVVVKNYLTIVHGRTLVPPPPPLYHFCLILMIHNVLGNLCFPFGQLPKCGYDLP
jgi:hypothetical protein